MMWWADISSTHEHQLEKILYVAAANFGVGNAIAPRSRFNDLESAPTRCLFLKMLTAH